MKPKVTLLTGTKLPLETVYSVWKASKDEEPLMTPEEVKEKVPDGEVRELFRRVIAQKIPIGEHVDFVFMIEGVSVSWREQAVRHRIGTLASPERVGADIVMGEIPNLSESSWWSQSMRIQDMSTFAERGNYRIPETIENHPERDRLMSIYQHTMEYVEESYRDLVKAGIPMEDARELIPLGAQHRISWKLNIGALQHIVGKRSCWILQLGIWGPVIEGMISELSKKVDPIFTELATPPCIGSDGEFKACIYHEENRRRYTGDDKLPVCPLHLTHHGCEEEGFPASPNVHQEFPPMMQEMTARAESYREFWGRNPYTGERDGGVHLKIIQK